MPGERGAANWLFFAVLPVLLATGSVVTAGDQGKSFAGLVARVDQLFQAGTAMLPDDDAKAVAFGRDVVSRQLRDPGSAVFRDVRIERRNGVRVVCGYVNAKNGFGGYMGEAPFVANAISAYVSSPGESNPAAPILVGKYCI